MASELVRHGRHPCCVGQPGQRDAVEGGLGWTLAAASVVNSACSYCLITVSQLAVLSGALEHPY